MIARRAALCLGLGLIAAAAAPSQAREAWESVPAPRALPRPAESGFVAHDGARIYYACFGHGSPVILLHGGLANGRYWGNQVPALTRAGYRAILIDSRGHGHSSRDARPYTYELMASDVGAVMDQLQLPKAAVVGWSDGAIIGLVMALHAPERVSRVFAFAANMDPSGVKPDAGQHRTFAYFERLAKRDYAELSPTPGGYNAFYKAIVRMWDTEPHYGPADLARIRTPVAIVDGDHDEAIKREHTGYLARSIPRAQLIIIPSASHFAMLQRPEAFNSAMLAFLRGG